MAKGPPRWATTGGVGRRARDVVLSEQPFVKTCLNGLQVDDSWILAASHPPHVPSDHRAQRSPASLSRCPCGVNRAISKIALSTCVPHEGFHRVSGQKTSAHIDHWGTDGSAPFQAVVQPVGGTRARRCRNVCAAHIHVGNAHSTHQEPSSVDGAANMPRRVEHTQPVTRRTFPPRARPLTDARTPALRQHPRTTQWDRVTRGRARR